jgi:hypothetical protein
MWENIKAGISFTARWAWRILKSLIVQVIAALIAVFVFILLVVRPFSAPIEEPITDDVGTAWNDSIARFGVKPIYPPSEDFYVGDVLAVIADAEDKPLLRTAVRIAHLDLRKEMLEADSGRPVFAETSEMSGANSLRHQESKEVSDTPSGDRVSLRLAAFPGITVTHAVRSMAATTWSLWNLGAGRTSQKIEQIRIPIAETYGAPLVNAYLRLDAWCHDEQTSIYCTDSFVRRLMAYTVSDRVLATRDGRYIAQLQLQLVTRVFLTREIEHRRFVGGADGTIVRLSIDRPRSSSGIDPGEKDENGSVPLARERMAAEKLRRDLSDDTPGHLPSDRIIDIRAEGAELALHEIFQRPVAFGYNSATIALPPATPSRGVSP